MLRVKERQNRFLVDHLKLYKYKQDPKIEQQVFSIKLISNLFKLSGQIISQLFLMNLRAKSQSRPIVSFIKLFTSEKLAIMIERYFLYLQQKILLDQQTNLMVQHLLRGFEHAMATTHLASGSAAPSTTALLIWLICFAILIVVTLLYLKTAVIGRYDIPISPTQRQQEIIMFIAIALIGIVGAYAYFGHANWSTMSWYHYGILCILFAVFIFVYQTSARYTLFFATLFIILVAVASYFLTNSAYHYSSHMTLLINLVGAIEGWALIWALYVLSQMLVHECNMSRKTSNVIFFVAAIVLIILDIIFRRGVYISRIGFLVMSIGILIVMFFRQKDSWFT